MTFAELLDQALALLQRHGRVTYQTLQLQFQLDDAHLAALKNQLLYAYPQVIDDGERGLVWTAERPAPEPEGQRGTEAERRFYTLLPAVIGLLRGERRITYRTLTDVFGLDDTLLEEIRKELTFRQVAHDERGEGLVWSGEQPDGQPPVANTGLPPPPETATITSFPPSEPARSTKQTEPVVLSPEASSGPRTPEPVRSFPEAERRHLTVMFCDLADSTQLSQQLDPEDLREVVRAYQATATEVIQQYQGHMAQYLGDGLLIYFGWPVAHEDDARRALHAGLGIVEAITTTLNPRLQHEKGVQLTVRLGVHTGPVVVGEMGGGGRYENLATGDTVNIAARLEGLAAPHAVIISQVTAQLVARAFHLENLGLQRLKGIAKPMQVFRVLGAIEVHDDETAAVGAPFLVGRDEEVGLLRRRWEQSKEGRGQVVLIRGEAGIGKSSLVAAVRTQVAQQESTRITFRCSPYHTNSALYPVIAHLEHVLGFAGNDTPGTKVDKLEQALRTTGLPLEESLPLIASLLSVPLDARYPALRLSPQQQRQRTLDTLVGWLLEEAERQPVLTVWEDLHWADPSMLEMLGLVLEQTPTVRMLHVLTFRPTFAPPWPTRSHLTPITLNRLERPQVEALIRRVAGGKVLPAAVVDHIVARTDGVPLFVEELTKALLESSLLAEDADQFALAGALETVAIPATLHDSLMARLDRLPAGRELAQIGAVVGREFSYEMLQGLVAVDETALQDGLAQLVDAELLYQRGRPPRATYMFKHALVQDAAYQSLLRSRRQHYH